MNMVARSSEKNNLSLFFALTWYALLLTPLIIDFKSSDIYFLAKSVYIKLLVSVLVVVWAIKVNRRGELLLDRGPATALIGLFLLLHGVSWFYATNLHEAVSFTANVFYFVLLYLVIVNNFTELAQLKRSLFVLFWVGALVAVYGVLQSQGLDIVVLEAGAEPVSTLGNVNFSAQYLIMLSPMLLTFIIWEQSKLTRAVCAAAWLLVNIHILLTFSRGGWVGLFFSWLFLGGLTLYLKREAWGLNKAKVIGGLLFLLILAGGFLATDFGRREIIPQVKSIVNPAHGANQGRLLIWRSTLRMIKDNPLGGVGAGNFKIIYPLYRDQREWSLSGRNSRLERAHNDYLQIAAELGLPGLGVFLGLLVFVYYLGLKIVFRAGSEAAKVIALACLSGLTAMLGHAFFSFPLRNPASSLTFYVLIGFIVALGGLSWSGQGKKWRYDLTAPASHYYYSLVAQAALLIVLMVVGFKAIFLPYFADRVYQSGRILERQRQWELAEAAYQKAVEISADNYSYLVHFGNVLSRRGKQAEAIEIYQRYIKLDPYHRNTYNNLGNAYEAMNSMAEAIKAYRKATEIDPQAAVAFLNLGNAYMKNKDFPDAIAAYLKVIAIDDKYPAVHHNLGDAFNAAGKFEKSNEQYLIASYDVKARPLLYQKMGYNYFQLHEYDLALKYLRSVFSLSDDPDVLYQNYKYLGNIYYQKALEAGKDLELLEQALSMWRQAYRINSSETAIRDNIFYLGREIEKLKKR